MRKILHSAFGNTTVAWSRPSVTTSPSPRHRRCLTSRANGLVVGGVLGERGDFQGADGRGHVLAIH